jgi:hypothetical protein
VKLGDAASDNADNAICGSGERMVPAGCSFLNFAFFVTKTSLALRDRKR